MHPADFYALAHHDRQRAMRYLLCYDAPGLWHLAETCAQHLFERFEVCIPTEQVLATWQRVALLSVPRAEAARRHWEHAVGE